MTRAGLLGGGGRVPCVAIGWPSRRCRQGSFPACSRLDVLWNKGAVGASHDYDVSFDGSNFFWAEVLGCRAFCGRVFMQRTERPR